MQIERQHEILNVKNAARVGVATLAAVGGAKLFVGKSAEAQEPNLAPNPSLETSNGSLPQDWNKSNNPDTYNLDSYNQGNAALAHTGTSSISERVKCVTIGQPPQVNGWTTDTNPANLIVLPDASQPLAESVWAKYEASSPPVTGEDQALFLTYFYDSGKNLIDWSSKNLELTNNWNTWAQISTTLQPNTDIPAGAKYFSFVLHEQPSISVCTTENTVISTLTYDDVEITDPMAPTPTVLSVGGVATRPLITYDSEKKAQGGVNGGEQIAFAIGGTIIGLATLAGGVKLTQVAREKFR